MEKQHDTTGASKLEEIKTKPSTEKGKGLHDLNKDQENEVLRKTKPMQNRVPDKDQ